MAKVKVINKNLDSNLNGTNFNNVTSQTVFSFGAFSVTSNFDKRNEIDYSNTLSSFAKSVTLETMGVSDSQSDIIYNYNTNAVLNLDKTNLNSYIRFGSAYEFLRVSVETIIINYRGSLFVDTQAKKGQINNTYSNYNYDIVSDTSTFEIPTGNIINLFGLIYNEGNTSTPDDDEIKNLNLSFDKYLIWTELTPDDNTHSIIGYTGNSINNTSVANYNKILVKVKGNPFSMATTSSAPINFHIKPNSLVFEEFRYNLNQYERNIISNRVGTDGFNFTIKDPILLDDGSIVYNDVILLWTTTDAYNIDINTSSYNKFLEILLTIGAKYDKIKTDLIARFLTPASLKAYDLTEEGKMTKLLRIYGREFDQIRLFIDSLAYINTVTYDKKNNIPDQLIKNLSRTFGWDYFSLVDEEELVSSFFTIDEKEKDLSRDLTPSEIDIELWRRILINTNYFWKTKGTREAIKAMFLLIGIPEPFINITEYVYTVEGKINPNTVPFTANDFPTNSLPYDNSGYPVAPLENNDFYFQISGDTDNGQAYMNVFRSAGFNLTKTIDNKKSWSQSGATFRYDNTTPQYYQEDSRLVLNTKEVGVSLDASRGVENDVYEYIKKDYEANSSGFTLPYSFVNISLNVSGSQNTFPLPPAYNPLNVNGDLEVRFNGILLNAPKSGTTTGITYQSDYTIDEISKTFTLTNSNYAKNNASRRDVIQATFIYSGSTNPISGITVQYIVTRVNATGSGVYVPLPSYPRGDIQLTVNGIALTKGTPQFIGDYTLDPNNSISGTSQIIILNEDLKNYLKFNPEVQIAYVDVLGSNDISARNEVIRIDSFNSSKIYFNSSANKYVYKLNYKLNNTSDVKILVDGIALEPNTDYSINVLNRYEIFLPKGLRYGNIISVYYLVANSEYFNPILTDDYCIGDITELTFLEYITLIQERLINARNRKTITDFKGGWYPSLLKIYVEYLKRSNLDIDDPLKSNGYSFSSLYLFLGKYNVFFDKFVKQLLPATIIITGNGEGGLEIRNSVYTKQKFTYKIGVNLYATGSTTNDIRGYNMIKHLGDDGSVFLIPQKPASSTESLFVETKLGVYNNNTIVTGGINIQGYGILTDYGIDYRKFSGSVWGAWIRLPKYGSLSINNYPLTISGVTNNTTYQYRSYVHSNSYGYTGNTLQIVTPAVPVAVPEIHTKLGYAGVTSIVNTGGENIIRYADTEFYGMQYKLSSSGTWITTALQSGALGVNNYTQTINSLSANTSYDYRAYMVVGGLPYYGLPRTISTTSVVSVIPIVVTGIASGVTTTTMNIVNNYVANKGNANIEEYGVLYTQNPAYSNSSSLVIGNYPASVGKESISSDININVLYFTGTTYTIDGLNDNTTTYYRAFARNNAGYGYGIVKNVQTEANPPQPFILNWHIEGHVGATLRVFDYNNNEVLTAYSTVSGNAGVLELEYLETPYRIVVESYGYDGKFRLCGMYGDEIFYTTDPIFNDSVQYIVDPTPYYANLFVVCGNGVEPDSCNID